MRGEVIRRRQTVTIRRYVKVEIPGGHTTDFKQFTDTAHEVEIEIDVDALFRKLGDKAARSQSGRSAIGSRIIIARRVRR
jgi:hypothetical protein